MHFKLFEDERVERVVWSATTRGHDYQNWKYKILSTDQGYVCYFAVSGTSLDEWELFFVEPFDDLQELIAATKAGMAEHDEELISEDLFDQEGYFKLSETYIEHSV